MIGREFSHYRVEERLGAGGMGVVYRGWDTLVDRPVALKFLQVASAGDASARKKLLREAQAAMSVVHENVCPVYGVEELPDGELCIAMGYCEGESLDHRLAAGAVPFDEALRLATGITAGLAAAHEAGLVHRDVKPSNIMLAEDGRARLLDFGIAFRPETLHTVRAQGAIGTPRYMAPEVLIGGEATPASDVFSLGIVLWQLLCGVHPFGRFRDGRDLARVFELDPAVEDEAAARVDPFLLKLLRRMLDQRMEVRPATATEVLPVLREELRRRASQADSPTERLAPPATRHRRTRMIVATMLVLAVAAAVPAIPRLGLFAPRTTRGLAIVAPRDAAGSLISEGVATVLTDELARQSRHGSSRWVVPHEWIDEVGAWSSRDATKLLGVDDVVLVEPAGLEGVRLSLVGPQGPRPESREFPAPPSMTELLRVLESWGLTSGTRARPFEHPHHPLYYRALGHLRRGTAAGDSAVVLFDRARTADDTPRVRLALAEALRRRLRDEADAVRAASILERLAAEGTLPVAARVVRGRLALDRGHPAVAQRWLREAADRAPADFQTLRYLAWAHEQQREFGAAGQIRRQAVEHLPDFVGSHERMGLYLYGRGLYREAWKCFERALEIAPGYGYSYNLLGACEVELGCWEQAVERFERSLEIDRQPDAVANLGFLYYHLGQFDEAISMYRWALNDTPDDHVLVGALAASLWWSGRQEEALATARRAAGLVEEELRTHEHDADRWLDLAGYRVLWDQEGSRAALERGLSLLPDDAGAGFLRAAAVHATLGDFEPALAALRRAVALGIPARQIEASPFLAPLRGTAGYHHLIRPLENSPADCPELPPTIRS